MNERITRVGLDDPIESRTDWARLRSLTEDDLERAIADDPDTFTVHRRPVKMRFEVFQDKANEWRWKLVHGNGSVIADSAEGYRDRRDAERGIELVRQAGNATEASAA